MTFSTSSMRRHGRWLIGAAMLVISCEGCGPTAPSCTDQFGRGATSFNGLDISCSVIGSALQCQAVATNKYDLYVYCPMQQDVTESAVWTTAGSSLIRMLAPGMFQAVGIGDSFVQASWQHLQSVMQPVSVFAGTPPLPTHEISGSVYLKGQTAGSGAIRGAMVQILDGLVAGRTATSGVPPPLLPGFLGPFGGPGYYRLLGVPPGNYRLRVTKDGYVSQERDVTVTLSTVADFQLEPV
jgi:carboxypeptidase family protein